MRSYMYCVEVCVRKRLDSALDRNNEIPVGVVEDLRDAAKNLAARSELCL